MLAHNKTRKIGGLPQGYLPFFITDLFAESSRSVLFVGSSNDMCLNLSDQIRSLQSNITVLTFLSWDCLPYDRISPSLDITTQRLNVLTQLAQEKNEKIILVVAANAFMQKLPPRSHISKQGTLFKLGDTLQRESLFKTFHDIGYHRVETVYEAGDYAVRGSIIDIFPTMGAYPIRIDCFGDVIETLKEFDPFTQKSLQTISSFSLQPASEILLNPESIQQFREQYRQIPVRAHGEDALYTAISEGRTFQSMEHWLPLFYEQTDHITDYLKDYTFVIDAQSCEAMRSHNALVNDYYQARLNPVAGDYQFRPLQPDRLYLTLDDVKRFESKANVLLSPFLEPDSVRLDVKAHVEIGKKRLEKDFLKQLCTEIKAESREKIVIISAATEGSYDRLVQILEENGFKTIVKVNDFKGITSLKPGCYLGVAPFEHGFIKSKYILYTEEDILGERINRKNHRHKKSDKFFQEMAQLQPNDLVVHRDHGVGRYLGLETVSVNNIAHDCLYLIYDGGDKLFLPVENIDLLSRYGSDSAIVSLDRLGSNAWKNRKDRVKKRIQIVADYLIKIAAERSLRKGFVFETAAAEYAEFCARFPYSETEDQLRAIDEVTEDLHSGRPMDRLVCGDVGFGKTEVALRAAHLAVLNKKQVAIVTPTTLLCRQHFQNFTRRFHGLPYNVEQLSRLVKQRDADRIRNGLTDGSVDIVIATHTLFSDKIKFQDLGLLIVDEEQHFGVRQKEKLKQLRSDVHVLTLTATPIPRTLQLALAGVRELSLITTPPVDRLPVRTFVSPYEPIMIREAILREHNRGGQVFYVTPRLEDLELLANRLRQIVPEVRFAIAHGQLSPSEIEDVITDFYDHKFDVLLSTNIIESGIDIPTANTMIIHRADLFGLAQLYQLRGRVGRSKVQAYAYFTLVEDQSISDMATKRLQIMQSLDSLGAGFTLASHDLDIRGAGNIVGEEQSGHIREVGVELYQNLLQEAIIMSRAESEGAVEQSEWTPQINLGTAVLIPELYVADLSLRLNLYRRIANLENRQQIDEFAAEMIDRFGKLPLEVRNLFEVIEIKSLCRKANIDRIDVGPKGIVIGFYENNFSNQMGLLQYLQSPEMVTRCKIRPDQKIFVSFDNPNPELRVKACKNICRKIADLVVSPEETKAKQMETIAKLGGA